jgi:uncharacterized membrane protein
LSAHLFIIHFPVALVLTGAAADVIGVAAGRPALRRHAGALLILGAVAALLAFLTGQGAMSAALLRGMPDAAAMQRIEAHSQWGAVGVWLLGGAGVLRALWRERLGDARGWVCLALAVASAALVTLISLSGTAIAHGG